MGGVFEGDGEGRGGMMGGGFFSFFLLSYEFYPKIPYGGGKAGVGWGGKRGRIVFFLPFLSLSFCLFASFFFFITRDMTSSSLTPPPPPPGGQS